MPTVPIIPLLNLLALSAVCTSIAYAARRAWQLRPRSLPFRRRTTAKRVPPYVLRKHAETSDRRKRALLYAHKLRVRAVQVARRRGELAPVRLGSVHTDARRGVRRRMARRRPQ